MNNIDLIINAAFGLANEEMDLPEAEFCPELNFLMGNIGHMDERQRDYFSIAVDDTALELGIR